MYSKMAQVFVVYFVPIALFVSITWALAPVLHRYVFQQSHIQARTMMILSWVAYSACIIPYALYHYSSIKKDLPKISAKGFFLIALSGILVGFISNLVYYYLVKHNKSALVSALVYSSPVFTLILAYIFIQEKVNMLGVFGILAITIGIVAITLSHK